MVFVELLLIDLPYSLYSLVNFLYHFNILCMLQRAFLFLIYFSELLALYSLYSSVSFLNQKLWKRLFSELFAVFSHFLLFGKIKIYFLPFGKTNLYYFWGFLLWRKYLSFKGNRCCVRLDLENVLRCYWGTRNKGFLSYVFFWVLGCRCLSLLIDKTTYLKKDFLILNFIE